MIPSISTYCYVETSCLSLAEGVFGLEEMNAKYSACREADTPSQKQRRLASQRCRVDGFVSHTAALWTPQKEGGGVILPTTVRGGVAVAGRGGRRCV